MTKASVPATLFSLHRTLWTRSFKSNPSQTWMVALFGFYALIGLVSVTLNVGLEVSTGPGRFHALTGAVALGTAALIVVSIFMPAGERQVGPMDLRGLPIDAATAERGLARVALWSSRVFIAAAVTLIFAVAGSFVLAANGAAAMIVVFVLGQAVSLVLAVVWTEVIAGGAQLAVKEMGASKTRTSMISGVGFVVLIFGFIAVQNLGVEGLPIVGFGEVAAWTPLGAGMGWAASVANGQWAQALGQLLAAVVFLALGLWLWRRQTARSFRQAYESGPQALEGTRAQGVGALRLAGLPYASPGAMEYKRVLRYFIRDTRLSSTLLLLPAMIIFAVVMSFGWRGMEGLFVLAFTGVLGGISASNDFGYAGPSNWVTMAVPVRPRVFLYARHLAMITPGVIAAVVLFVILLIIQPDPSLTVLVGVATLGLLLSACGLSMVMTTFNPYPMSAPGANPWTDKSGMQAAAFISAFVVLLAGWLPIAPGGILMILGVSQSSALLTGLGVLVTVALPSAIYAAAWVICGKRVDKQMPEIYAKVGTYVK
ncbi:hypothetical protein ACUY2E_04195 [Corynebacterium confusum]|uniref:hypothetical protein n=1 Tax=uncultured Corynebacterium sp. TaxID=159447 RepID=UPI0025F232A1|nr:hypothetical protein [uncultured Corynebacterium sp.]